MATGPVGGSREHGNRFVRWAERSVERYASGRAGSLALGWLQRFTEANRNSSSALVLNMFLSAIPALLAVYALADLSASKGNGVARHLVRHLDLHGETAALVSHTFGTIAHNAAAASVIGLLGFVIFGLAVGKVLQEVYVRAWRVRSGTLTDQWRFALWFIVATSLLGLWISEESLASTLGTELLVPAWIAILAAFWLWTPWFLMHREIAARRLVPGALLAAAAYAVALSVSQLLVGRWVNENGHFFGSFGVALALLLWGQLFAGISLACAVFPPVYIEWRRGWTLTGASPFALHEDASERRRN